MALSIADGGLGPNSLRCAYALLAFHTSSRVRLMWRVTSFDSVLRACSSATVSAYVAIGSTSASVASRARGCACRRLAQSGGSCFERRPAVLRCVPPAYHYHLPCPRFEHRTESLAG